MNRKHDIIEALYNSKEINDAIAGMEPSDLRDDLKSEMFMVLFTMDDNRVFEMHEKGYLRFFLIRTMLNMIKSDRSTFWKNYRNMVGIKMDRGEIASWIDDHEGEDKMVNFVGKDMTEADYLQDQKNIELSKVFGVTNNELYERDMFLLYVFTFNCNARGLSRSTGIPYQTVIRTLAIAKNKLKKHLCTED